MISSTRVQTNDLLVASLQVLSYEPKSCELQIYHIESQLIATLSLCELQANKIASDEPASLGVSSHKVNKFQGWALT